MDIKNKEALIAEIEQFKEEALKMHIVQVLADSYTNTNLFDYNIDSDGSVIWYKAQARQLWDFWLAKNQAVPEGFVLVPKEPYAYLIKHKLWNKNSQPEIYLADDFIGNDGVEKEKLIVCIPLYKGGDESQEQKA